MTHRILPWLRVLALTAALLVWWPVEDEPQPQQRSAIWRHNTLVVENAGAMIAAGDIVALQSAPLYDQVMIVHGEVVRVAGDTVHAIYNTRPK